MRAHAYIDIIKVTICHLCLMLFHRQRIHHPLLPGDTSINKRAEHTVGRSRSALQRAKIHYRLIINPRLRFIQQLRRHFRKNPLPFCRVYGRFNPQPARKHPINIPIHHSIRHSISKRTNGSRSILSHSFQSQHLFICFRKTSGIGHATRSSM